MEKASIKKVTWKQIRKKVDKVNPILANTIDAIDPSDDFTLYHASYPYGSVIVEDGVFHIPLPDGKIVPSHDIQVDNQIKSDFNYPDRGIPPGVVLNNSYELFINAKGNVLPILVTQPGSIFALWKKLEFSSTFHPSNIFNITAGARSIFMLPNISDIALHKNLKRDFNIRQSPPKNLLDQWEIFKSIAHHPEAKCNWATELLFFPVKWLEKIKNDKSWQPLFLFLLQNVWNSCAYERNRVFYDFAISCAQANRNLKPNPYLSDTLRHLIMISLGTGVGFGIATNEMLAPIETIQKIYSDSYGVKRYAPTLMHPMHFSLFDFCNPVYYSLSLPTTLEFSPKSRKISSTLHDLSELKHILNIFLDEVRCGRLKIEETVIGKLATHLEFDFFHNKYDRHGEIRPTREMLVGDATLTKSLNKREFAESGTFVRGCVRLSHKNNA